MEQKPPAGQADLDGLIDSNPVGSFHRVVIALCALMVMIDGFDTQVIGMVAPAIAASWHVTPASFGAVFGIGLFGGLIGVLDGRWNRSSDMPETRRLAPDHLTWCRHADALPEPPSARGAGAWCNGAQPSLAR